MATKTPLILNGIKFQVNPMGLAIDSKVVTTSLATQGGIRFQTWYDSPQTLTITGMSAGETAYQELQFLKTNFEYTNTQGLSRLFYKNSTYTGFIQSINVSHNVDAHLRFPYQIVFQLIQGQKFNFYDFAFNPTGLISSSLNQVTSIINVPIANATNNLNTAAAKII
jgi:hypothetical protein